MMTLGKNFAFGHDVSHNSTNAHALADSAKGFEEKLVESHATYLQKYHGARSPPEAMNLGSPPSGFQSNQFMPAFLLGEVNQTGFTHGTIPKNLNTGYEISKDFDFKGSQNSSVTSQLMSTPLLGCALSSPQSSKKNVSWKMTSNTGTIHEDEEDRQNYLNLMRHNGRRPPPKCGLNASLLGDYLKNSHSSISHLSPNSFVQQTTCNRNAPFKFDSNSQSMVNRRIPGGLYSPCQLEDWSQHSVGVNEFTDGPNKASHWVTVFGFPHEKSADVYTAFAQIGVVDYYTNVIDGNWMHIRYRQPSAASVALKKNGLMIASNFMVGVKPCTEEGLINHYDDAKLGIDGIISTPLKVTSDQHTMYSTYADKSLALKVGEPDGDISEKENISASAGRSPNLRARNLGLMLNSNLANVQDEEDSESNKSFLGKAFDFVFGK